MGCFIVPAVGALVHFFMRKKIPALKNDSKQRWLNQLLAGGAIFGVVDHLWNGELFLIGPNILADLALGVVITAVIFGAWSIMVLRDKLASRNEAKA